MVPPTEEELPSEEGVEGGKGNILADITDIVLKSAWLILLFVALAILWFIFSRKKKKAVVAMPHED